MPLKSYLYLIILVLFSHTFFIGVGAHIVYPNTYPTLSIGLAVFMALKNFSVKSVLFISILGLINDSTNVNLIIGPNITYLVAVHTVIGAISHRLFVNSNIVLYTITILSSMLQILALSIFTYGYHYIFSSLSLELVKNLVLYGATCGLLLFITLPLIKKISIQSENKLFT